MEHIPIVAYPNTIYHSNKYWGITSIKYLCLSTSKGMILFMKMNIERGRFTMTKKVKVIFAVLSIFILSVLGSSQVYAAASIASSTMVDGQLAVMYIDASNHLTFYMINGSRAWRNNNPGNLKYEDPQYATARGVIGTDYSGFAIFPDYNTGYAALSYCIRDKYKDSSIEDTMYCFAPPNENNTEAYIDYLVNSLGGGVTRETKISSLTWAQQTTIIDSIKNYEGYTPGTTDMFYW